MGKNNEARTQHKEEGASGRPQDDTSTFIFKGFVNDLKNIHGTDQGERREGERRRYGEGEGEREGERERRGGREGGAN